jgi:histone H3/H4
MTVLQEASESYITDRLKMCDMLSRHAGRSTINENDFKLALYAYDQTFQSGVARVRSGPPSARLHNRMN